MEMVILQSVINNSRHFIHYFDTTLCLNLSLNKLFTLQTIEFRKHFDSIERDNCDGVQT